MTNETKYIYEALRSRNNNWINNGKKIGVSSVFDIRSVNLNELRKQNVYQITDNSKGFLYQIAIYPNGTKIIRPNRIRRKEYKKYEAIIKILEEG